MTPIDDLKIGQWIAVCGDREHKRVMKESTAEVMFTGEPCQIKSINLPFLAVTMGATDEGEIIDIRRFGVVRLSRHYVRTVIKMIRERPADTMSEPSSNQSCCQPCCCPNCGATIY